MEKRMVIIDGNSLLYRAFYALPILSHDGIYTNAVYGFLRMLNGLYKTLDPEYVAVAFDKGSHTFRTDMYDGYKSTRKPAPEELAPQFTLIRDVLRVMGVALYEVEGYEGDDILGTLSTVYEKEMPVLIVTGDRDALQLVTEKTTVLLTQKGISQMAEMSPAAVKEKYGITPDQVVDMKALMGDDSDHIPGVLGIGEKSALKLLGQYETLDGIYNHLDDIKGAMKKKLIEGKELAYLSRTLATIRRDIPLSFQKEEMKQPIHADEMQELFGQLGFGRLIEEFSLLPRFQELKVKKRDDQRMSSIEFERWSQDVFFEEVVVGVSVDLEGKAPFFAAKKVIVATEEHVYMAEPPQYKELANALAKAKAVVIANGKMLFESDFPVEGIPLYDVTIAAYLLDPTRVTYPFSLMAEMFRVPPIFLEGNTTFEERGALSAIFLQSLYAPSVELLNKEGVKNLFHTIELPLIPVLSSMEKVGIATDTKRWAEAKEDMKKKERELLRQIYEEAGEVFNVNSPKQLGYILFEKLGMPAIKKTKTGYSTAADVLEELSTSYPFVKYILSYRTLSKLTSTYLEALPELIRKKTGRIHTSFNQTVTATGRLSSSEPNLQNIPIRTEEGRKIRSLFIPGEGYECFISCDYSQVELRIMAHMSGDESLIGAFLQKEDIHRRTAAEVLGIPFKDVTEEQRSHAKAVNFGIIYGISDFGLSRQLGISKTAAGDYIKSYFARYPAVHEFMGNLIEKARETGRAETLFGRYRSLPDIKSKNFQRRSLAERTAMNTPIQGTAADIMKLAMIEVHRLLRKGGYKSRLLLQVHDELIIETIESERKLVSTLVKKTMESMVDLRVPLVADVHVGNNWAETK